MVQSIPCNCFDLSPTGTFSQYAVVLSWNVGRQTCRDRLSPPAKVTLHATTIVVDLLAPLQFSIRFAF